MRGPARAAEGGGGRLQAGGPGNPRVSAEAQCLIEGCKALKGLCKLLVQVRS